MGTQLTLTVGNYVISSGLYVTWKKGFWTPYGTSQVQGLRWGLYLHQLTQYLAADFAFLLFKIKAMQIAVRSKLPGRVTTNLV